MTTGRSVARSFVLSVLSTAWFCAAAGADSFSGGSGTPEDPYQITTVEQLSEIGSDLDLLDKHFILATDVNCAPMTFAHAVIGFEQDPRGGGVRIEDFTGTFCGAGHKIVNLTIEAPPGSSTCGLFARLGLTARVWDLGVENASVSCDGSAGILAASNSGRIWSCYTTGSVVGTNYVGGLVGRNVEGTIIDSYSRAAVTGHDYVGGLLGEAFRPSWSIDPVRECYAAGPVAGGPDAQHVGGLVGHYAGEPWDDFALTACFLRQEDGGGPNNRLGRAVSDAELRSQATFAGWDFVGTDEDGTDDVWFMPPVSYPVLNSHAHMQTIPDVNGLTLAEATIALESAGFAVSAETAEDYHRTLPAGELITTEPYEYAPAGSTIQIIVSQGPCDWNDVPGTGTAEDPYLIATAGVLEALADNTPTYATYEAYVKLTDDINMSGRQYDDAVMYASFPVDFRGVFDGDHHTIRYLRSTLVRNLVGQVRNLNIEGARIRRGASGQVGILADLSRGTISNCRVTGQASVGESLFPHGSSVYGPSVGGLVGTNEGTIAGCQSFVHVIGVVSVGGLVGENFGTIADSHAGGLVTGHAYSSYVGGLVGSNRAEDNLHPTAGTVTRCSAGGEVSISDFSRSVGGLVGDNAGQIRFSYASGPVRAEGQPSDYLRSPPYSGSDAGGLVGYSSGQITGCYATGSVSGYSNVGGLLGYNAGLQTTGSPEVSGLVRNCYATGAVTSPVAFQPPGPLSLASTVGGLVGRDFASTQSSYFLDSDNGGGPDNGSGIPLTDALMQVQGSFVDWGFYGSQDNASDDHWFMPAGMYPVLSWQTECTGLEPLGSIGGLPEDEARTLLADIGFVPDEVSLGDYDRRTNGWTRKIGDVLGTIPSHYARPGDGVALVVNLGLYDWALNSGDGTAENPYVIATAGELEAMQDLLEPCWSHFVLANDIDMTDRVYEHPLIALGEPFAGRFDGRGHRISNLTISESGWYQDGLGLFGSLDADGEICDLTICRAELQCANYIRAVGILAGVSGGTISDCHVSGQIVAGEIAGGLVGYVTQGQILRCSATVSIDSHDQVGGLVGGNGGTIESCYADARVVCSEVSGGLVGRNGGVLSNCYAQGDIQGYEEIGGLVGANYVSYGGPRSGGGVEGYIHQCYSKVSVSASSAAGGLVGSGNPASADASYYIVPQEDPDVGNSFGEGLTLDQMQDRDSFVGWDFYGSAADGVDDLWFMPDGGTPVLSWQTPITGLQFTPDLAGLSLAQASERLDTLGLTLGDILKYDYFSVAADRVGLAVPRQHAVLVPFGSPIDVVMSLGPYDWTTMNPGTGSAEAPYEIATAGQLLFLLRDYPLILDSHFVLTSDIDMIGRAFVGISLPSARFPELGGTLDGQGHLISNLTIDAGSTSYPAGLLGRINPEGHVANLGLENVRVLGDASAMGTLAGENYGTVARCYSAGRVDGSDTVGGLIGRNVGHLTDCYATGTVSGVREVGGLVGSNGQPGGRSGMANPGYIDNCYAAVQVAGTPPTGGLLAINYSGDTTDSYYLIPQATAGADNALGTPLTAAQMTAAASFEHWDFAGDIWTCCEGQDSPRLSWENRPCP